MDADRNLIESLDSFCAGKRCEALARLSEAGVFPDARSDRVNMHMHSFFSYNAVGHSPSHLAWDCRRAGLSAAALCDFDVLDGIGEFHRSGMQLGLRTSASIETRVFVEEYRHADINSPGEEGVAYVMGAGFVGPPPEDSPPAVVLGMMRHRAAERNLSLVQRINACVPELELDYQSDVIPLTPSGNATERHIVTAYLRKSGQVFTDHEELLQFWSHVLSVPVERLDRGAADAWALEEAVRSGLVKRGGLAYEKPDSTSFPPLETFFRMVRDSKAVPMIAWLDGLSGGEADAGKLLDFMASKGACALNLIPDRNWNVDDPDLRAKKVAKLREIAEAAVGRDMPVHIGTELNKPGLPLWDDLQTVALAPFRDVFLQGACLFVGHTWLLRYADFSYTGPKSREEFGTRLLEKNSFFSAVGSLPPIDTRIDSELRSAGTERAFRCLADSARIGRWNLGG